MDARSLANHGSPELPANTGTVCQCLWKHEKSWITSAKNEISYFIGLSAPETLGDFQGLSADAGLAVHSWGVQNSILGDPLYRLFLQGPGRTGQTGVQNGVCGNWELKQVQLGIAERNARCSRNQVVKHSKNMRKHKFARVERRLNNFACEHDFIQARRGKPNQKLADSQGAQQWGTFLNSSCFPWKDQGNTHRKPLLNAPIF